MYPAESLQAGQGRNGLAGTRCRALGAPLYWQGTAFVGKRLCHTRPRLSGQTGQPGRAAGAWRAPGAHCAQPVFCTGPALAVLDFGPLFQVRGLLTNGAPWLRRPSSFDTSSVCFPHRAPAAGGRAGVRDRRGAGAGWRRPSISTNRQSAALCGCAAASARSSTGAQQTSVPSSSTCHLARGAP